MIERYAYPRRLAHRLAACAAMLVGALAPAVAEDIACDVNAAPVAATPITGGITREPDGGFRLNFTAPPPAGGGAAVLERRVVLGVSLTDPATGKVARADSARTLRTVAGGYSPGYTADGELVGDVRRTGVTWSAMGRITAITMADGRVMRDTHDAEGRRILRQTYDATGALLATRITRWVGWTPVHEVERDGDGALLHLRRYLWGLDLDGSQGGMGHVGALLAVECDGKVYATVTDAAGHIIALADTTGKVVARYDYGPFGEPIRETGPAAAACPFRWNTRYYDADTGLYYFGYRHYDPISGRWLSREPLGEGAALNLYAYCDGDPVNKFDYLGLEAMDYFTLDNWKGAFDYPRGNGWEDKYSRSVWTIADRTNKTLWGIVSAPGKIPDALGTGAAYAVTPAVRQDVNGAVASMHDRMTTDIALLASDEKYQQATWNYYKNRPVEDWVGDTYEAGLNVALMGGAGTKLLGSAGRISEISSGVKDFESVTHLTNPNAGASIMNAANPKIGGRWGVFALKTESVPSNGILRNIKTLVRGDLSAEVVVTGEAAAKFRSPPVVGPFSYLRKRMGVVRTPLGSVEVSGRFRPGEIFKDGAFMPASRWDYAKYYGHEALLNYAPDASLYGGFGFAGYELYSPLKTLIESNENE